MELKGKLIYVVEDNHLNRTVFQMALIVHGAKVEFERWGKDAVERLQQIQDSHGVDLIVLDLMLHDGVSGFDIYTQIRKLPEFTDTPIVAVSAIESSLAMPKAKELGFSGFISKPIDEELFPRQLAKIIVGETIWYDGDNTIS